MRKEPASRSRSGPGLEIGSAFTRDPLQEQRPVARRERDHQIVDQVLLELLDSPLGVPHDQSSVTMSREAASILANLGRQGSLDWPDGDFTGDGQVLASQDVAWLLQEMAAVAAGPRAAE